MSDQVIKDFSKHLKVEKTVENLVRNIQREKTPQHLLILADQLQAALDAREKSDD